MEVVCQYCNSTFKAKRKTAKYCSDNCRINWHRTKEKIYTHFYDARFAIRAILHLMKEHDELTLLGDSYLSKLSDEISTGRRGEMMKKIIELENKQHDN